jgi:hypothetical protein
MVAWEELETSLGDCTRTKASEASAKWGDLPGVMWVGVDATGRPAFSCGV